MNFQEELRKSEINKIDFTLLLSKLFQIGFNYYGRFIKFNDINDNDKSKKRIKEIDEDNYVFSGEIREKLYQRMNELKNESIDYIRVSTDVLEDSKPLFYKMNEDRNWKIVNMESKENPLDKLLSDHYNEAEIKNIVNKHAIEYPDYLNLPFGYGEGFKEELDRAYKVLGLNKPEIFNIGVADDNYEYEIILARKKENKARIKRMENWAIIGLHDFFYDKNKEEKYLNTVAFRNVLRKIYSLDNTLSFSLDGEDNNNNYWWIKNSNYSSAILLSDILKVCYFPLQLKAIVTKLIGFNTEGEYKNLIDFIHKYFKTHESRNNSK